MNQHQDHSCFFALSSGGLYACRVECSRSDNSTKLRVSLNEKRERTAAKSKLPSRNTMSRATRQEQASNGDIHYGDNALGLESGLIPDHCLTSLSYSYSSPPSCGRLNGPMSWAAKSKEEPSYLEVDLGAPHYVCAVATQGNPLGNNDFVESYNLEYSADGEEWQFYEDNGDKLIKGNTSYNTAVKVAIHKELFARYVRFWPIDFYIWPCMRVEVYGRPREVTYNMTMKVTEVKGFGSDGYPSISFYVQLFGEVGSTKKISLDAETTKHSIETEELFKFTFTAADVGKVRGAKLGYEKGSGFYSDDSCCRCSCGRRRRKKNHKYVNYGSGFYVEELEVGVKNNGHSRKIPCKLWILQEPEK